LSWENREEGQGEDLSKMNRGKSYRLMAGMAALILLGLGLSLGGCHEKMCWDEVYELAPDTCCSELFGISGDSALDVYAVGYDIMLLYEGYEWLWVRSNFGGSMLSDVWISPTGNVFVVDREGTVSRYDGSVWEDIHYLPDSEFSSVWGTDDTNLYVVGSNDTNGILLHYKDGLWQEEYSWPDRCFGNVWGLSADEVYASGCGKLLYFGGDSWAEVQTGFEFKAGNIWGTSADDIFAVGTNVYHYDGISWSIVDTGIEEGGRDVWGRGPDDLFYVGKEGVAVHYDGDTWSDVSMSESIDLEAVGGTTGGEVFAVGNTWENRFLVGKVFKYICD
jgi:hypothetical protein